MCKGSTTVSESVCLGSIPSSAAKNNREWLATLYYFFVSENPRLCRGFRKAFSVPLPLPLGVVSPLATERVPPLCKGRGTTERWWRDCEDVVKLRRLLIAAIPQSKPMDLTAPSPGAAPFCRLRRHFPRIAGESTL